MSKNNKKVPPKKQEKEILDLKELLVDNSNKTMILDLNEIEFDNNQDEMDELDELEIDDERTEDISMRSKKASSIIIDDKPELDLDDLLEERTIDNFEPANTGEIDASQDKTVVISIEDIIETPPKVETENLVKDDKIFKETLDGLSTTGNTFIKNIDKKISDSLSIPEKIPIKKHNIEQEEDSLIADESNISIIEKNSEKLLDLLIYGKLGEFERELSILQSKVDNSIVDLIKYMFEFYVKKDD